MKKALPTDEELIQKVAGYNPGSAHHWRAQFELQRRAAERAGASNLFWAKVAGIAAIVAVLVSVVALLK